MILRIIIILFPFLLLSQNKPNYKFGEISDHELSIKRYEKDTTANALVLYEEGKNYFKVIDGYVRLIKKQYFKIKIFNKNAIDKANVEIPLYIGKNNREIITEIKAFTHNGNNSISVLKKDIYTKKINSNWEQTIFTFPDVKENSIIEYEYTITSPFFFNLTGWSFQSDIPKIKSLFTAEIPGNYKFNRELTGDINLDINDASIKKRCFYIPTSSSAADCEVLKYGINNVPAFVEEDYMLSKSNYISAIRFELFEYTNFHGEKTKFSKSWKDVDKEFRADPNIGKQSKKKTFFKNKLPQDLLLEKNLTTKAKKIYSYIQNHFNSNGNYGVFKNSKIKKAYEEKVGSSSEINLSLLNALNAADLKADFVLLSTRNNGLPTQEYPVITDFNYLVVLLTINDKKVLLDASEKELVFGTLPFKCLNYIGRVMDFDNGSYWIDIKPHTKNLTNVTSKIVINDNSDINAEVTNTSLGYFAVNQINNIKGYNREDYYKSIINDNNEGSISSYKIENRLPEENKLTEKINIEFDEQDENYITLYPFLIDILKENPFKLNKRTYPVDFGFPFKLNYYSNITIPDNYQLINKIENKEYNLPNNGGKIYFFLKKEGNQINISLRANLNKYHFKAINYSELKKFFDNLVTLSYSTQIVLKKQ